MRDYIYEVKVRAVETAEKRRRRLQTAQGQTLSRVGIYLEKDFFSHGQLYVAISRVGKSRDIKMLTRCGQFDEKPGCYADNVVYGEVLTNLYD